MNQETLQNSEKDISLQEIGAAGRKALMAKCSNLFKRFGKGVDVSIGAAIVGAKKTGEAIDTGIGATIEGVRITGQAINSGVEMATEKVTEVKEAAVLKVKEATEGAKNLIDIGIVLTQEKYQGVKDGIIGAKRGFLSFMNIMEADWEKKRNDAKERKLQADLAKLRADHKARIEASVAHAEEAKRIDEKITTLILLARA